MNRQLLLSWVNIISFIVYFSLTTAFAQNPDSVKIESTKLTDNIYMLTGQGGNIGVCIGENGVFMIDAQFAPLTAKIKAKIAELSKQPIRFVLNTHWHGDHTGGNQNLSNDGVVIVAHKNVRKRMSTEQFMQAFGRKVPASPEAALPIVCFDDNIQFHLNGEDILVFHMHHGHTDGDAIVYFPKSNVIHMGDTYFQGKYPFIDLSSGGSVDGLLKTVNGVLLLSNDETQIIPGHGKLSNQKELTEYRNMILTIRNSVRDAVKAGKTLEETQEMGLTKAFDDAYGTGFIKPDAFVKTVYQDLKKTDSSPWIFGF